MWTRILIIKVLSLKNTRGGIHRLQWITQVHYTENYPLIEQSLQRGDNYVMPTASDNEEQHSLI